MTDVVPGLEPDTQTPSEVPVPDEPQPVSIDQLDPEDLDSEYAIPDGDVLPRSVVEKLRDRDAKNRIRYRDLNKQMEEWGGTDRISRAIEIDAALSTREGVEDLVAQAIEVLGAETVQKLLAGESEVPEAEGSDDDDVPLTRREYKELQEKQAREREQARTVEVNRSAVNSKLDELGIKDPEERYLILSLGNKHVAPDEMAAEKLVAAVEKGHQEWQKLSEQKAEQYLKTKAAKAEQTPTALSGTAPVTGEVPTEPKNTAEAHKRFLKSMQG